MSAFDAYQIRIVRKVVRIGNKDYRLDFDQEMFAQAEQVYATRFERETTAGTIIAGLLAGATSALMAIVYGALRSGGNDVSWDTFSKQIWCHDQYDAIFDATADAVTEMFGALAESAEETASAEKN